MLRLAVAAVLLLTAAGALYGRDDLPPVEPGLRQSAATPTPDPSRLPVPANLVGVPVPLGEPTALAVLHPGDRVDLLSVPADGGDPVPHADEALVLAVDSGAATLFLALTPAQAHDVVSAPASARFAVIVRP